jgi:hypothetical protein
LAASRSSSNLKKKTVIGASPIKFTVGILVLDFDDIWRVSVSNVDDSTIVDDCHLLKVTPLLDLLEVTSVVVLSLKIFF